MKIAKITSVALVALLAGMALVGLGPDARADGDPPLAALGPPPVPPDNPQTSAKIELGKLLFFDTRLSGDASVACATCHEPKQSWGFSNDISRGYPGTLHGATARPSSTPPTTESCSGPVPRARSRRRGRRRPRVRSPATASPT